MFYRSSRYRAVEDCKLVVEGRQVSYKAIRIIPDGRSLLMHTVEDGDRVDRIAFRYLRDPESFWKICDLNGALWPPELTAVPGRRIRIPPSEV